MARGGGEKKVGLFRLFFQVLASIITGFANLVIVIFVALAKRPLIGGGVILVVVFILLVVGHHP